tara:strand:- start:239498 stop:239668 length:171 start_codon:yes stop_codon:yes gene_type:complete
MDTFVALIAAVLHIPTDETGIYFASFVNFRQNAPALYKLYTGDEWQKMMLLKWKAK